MVAARAARGLSEADLDRLRRSLAGGRKPKVAFTAAAGQLAGQAGQVVELADPTLSDEWLMVRFGRDTLPFSPADLEIPAKPARSTSARPATVGNPRPARAGAATTAAVQPVGPPADAAAAEA